MTRFLLTTLLVSCFHGLASAGDWPTWRGPNANGRAPDETPPELGSPPTWRVPLAHPGNSSPIVLGDRVFLTSADPGGHRRSLLCFARTDGELLWRHDVAYEADEPTHKTNPHCAASPVTDGNAVYAWLGSAGFVACSLDGELLWRRDLGTYTHIWGFASSPVLVGDDVVQYAGPGLNCRLFWLDRKTGEPRIEKPLPEAQSKGAKQFKGSWATPFLHGDTLVLPLPRRMVGFDAASGDERWRCAGLSDLHYTNPLVGEGHVVGMCGYGGPAMALRLPADDDHGDLTASHRLWVTDEKNPQRIGSGLLHDGHLYILNATGVAQCFELATGREVWKERFGGSSWGSMSLVGDRIFVVDQSATVHVLAPSPSPRVHGKHPLGRRERCNASPAFSDGRMFLRTHEALYCFGKDGE